MPITRDQLLASYTSYLMSRITLVESATFGGQIMEICRGAIAEHKELEEQYLREQLAARNAEVAELKAISHK